MITQKQDNQICDCVRNPDDFIYDLMKLAEESNELSAVIMQFLNKPHKRQDLEQKLIDEIGDVMLRIAFLRNNWDLGEFNKRVNSRISDKIGKICK